MAEQTGPTNNLNDTTRREWKIGSQVEIFSESQQKWLPGEITNIMKYENDEWLIIKYDGFSLKEMPRFSEFIRPITNKNIQINDDETNDIDYTRNISKYRNELKYTWQKLLETKDESGLAIYNTIIFDSKVKDNMTTKSKHISMIFQNTNLKQQSLRFMNMLSTIINSIDEPEILIEKLKMTAQIHANTYKVDYEHYFNFKHGFMKGIKRKLIDIWNMKYDDAWEWFWDYMISIMTEPKPRRFLVQKMELVEMEETQVDGNESQRNEIVVDSQNAESVRMDPLIERIDKLVDMVDDVIKQ